MAAFFLKKKKEVTETVEEPQKTVEAAKKEAETVNTEPPATIVCPACGREINKKTAEKNKYVCYECGNYFRVRTKNRIRMVADKDTFEPWFEELESKNPLDFPGYPEKIKAAQEKTGLHEAVTVGKCRIYGLETVIGVCDARFMMSSMGHVVGEKIALAVERATELSLPVILFCCSGGARMQEGIVSLMQMAKTAAALKKHSEAGLLYVPVLTDPTTGGVTASFAMLGDIILAEPGALIGFAGPRVIEQTIGEKLPEGFQRAQFQLEHGFVDAIVERKDLKMTLYRILKMHQKTEGYANFDPLRSDDCYEPPSNVMICPVRYSFPVASCTARWAVSSGVPNLPAGISSASSARSSSEKQAFICVSMTPQAIALTWILLGASSFASAFVKELMPPLHAE